MTQKDWLEDFGYNLSDLMKDAGITQKELSKRTGIEQSNLSRYMKGQQTPSVKTVMNLAYELDCNYEDLLGFADRID